MPVEPTGSIDCGLRDTPAIEFKNVSFAYEEGAPVLDGTSFIVPRGKTVAVVGASGGGKSTLLRLLCGFYRPQKGSILIEGIAFDEWNLECLRSRFSYVSQHAYLFPVSVGENIAIGKPRADMEEIERAAKAANAAGFISELPKQYDTLAGERGSRLSGGQIQRISIARAILKDAPILLLDEATSALDSETEAAIMESINHLKGRKTMVIIAHRLNTIENCDILYRVENGTIVRER